MNPDRYAWRSGYADVPERSEAIGTRQYLQVGVGVLCAALTLLCFCAALRAQNAAETARAASGEIARMGQDVKRLLTSSPTVIAEKINAGSIGFQNIEHTVSGADPVVAANLRKLWVGIRRDALMNRVDTSSIASFERTSGTAELRLLDDVQHNKAVGTTLLVLGSAFFFASFGIVIFILRMKPTRVVIERVVQVSNTSLSKGSTSGDDWLVDVSRRHFESTFELLPVACASFSTDGKITAWNGAMEDATGLGATEVFQKSFWDMVQWQRLGELGQNTIYKLLQGEPIEMIDWIYEHPLGERLDFRCKLIPVFGSTNSVISAVAAISDVTLQRRQECMLIENDVTKSAMLSAIPDTLLRLDVEAKLVDLRDNAGFVDKPALQLLGETTWPFALGPRLAEAIKAAAKETRLSRGHITVEFHSEPGEPERHIDIRVAPCGQSDVLAILHDITDRYRAQTAIEDAAARLRHLIEGSADLLMLVDATGMIQYQSPASRHVLGVGEGANVGRQLIDVVEGAPE